MHLLSLLKQEFNEEMHEKTKPVIVNIIHFNDVYNVEPENGAGAAYFVSALKQLRCEHTITVFSGDILSPSSMSTVTMGQQMIDLMKFLCVDYACVGNHDFDFGLEKLKELVSVSRENSSQPTKWFLSNLLDYESKQPLPMLYICEVSEHLGVKIGWMGLVESEWIDTLGTIDRDELFYEDFVEKGRDLAIKMRKEEGAKIVIAITHMRLRNDVKLLNVVDEIDIILGGHDHDDAFEQVGRRVLVKSGSDFHEITLLKISVEDELKYNVYRYFVNHNEIEPDPQVEHLVSLYSESIESKLDETLGLIGIELDGRFATVRKKESNLGNFICDCVMRELDVDCVLLNSGSLRSDRIHKAGQFKLRDLRQILPMPDQMIVIKCTGHVIKEALENSVSKWPSLEGRFVQVAGIRFSFDPRLDPGERILVDTLMINDIEMNLEEEYKVCMKEYMHKGKDGYSMLMNCELVVDEENGPCLPNTVINYFNAIKDWNEELNNQKSGNERHHHRMSIVSRQSSKTLLIGMLEEAKRNELNKLKFKAISTAVAHSLQLHKKVLKQTLGSKSLASCSVANQAVRYQIKQSNEYQNQLRIECEKAVVRGICTVDGSRITNVAET